jgi:hypothetical protein
MKRTPLSLLASMVLTTFLALPSPAAAAAQSSPAANPTAAPVAKPAGDLVTVPEAIESHYLFDEDEMAELAALESENVELQQQTAGFFGPRIGTVLIIVLLLVLLL